MLRKEKGTYFESSEKRYPDIELPKWMVEGKVQSSKGFPSK
jgi:hypothetical protein